MSMVTIIQATSDQDIQHVIELSTEYVNWIVATLQTTYTDLDTTPFLQAHAYENLRARFPGDYVPPAGRLLLALDGEQVCGCVALAQWTDTICEMQTLFVRPACRGRGVARQLVSEVIGSAKQVGYQTMRLDTLAFMTGAQQLYQSVGFYAILPYRDGAGDIQPYIRFFELNLENE